MAVNRLRIVVYVDDIRTEAELNTRIARDVNTKLANAGVKSDDVISMQERNHNDDFYSIIIFYKE